MMKLYLQIEKLAMEPGTEGPACEAEHSTALEDISMLLNHSEARIRTKSGDLLAQLVPVLSQSALQGVGQLLLTSIALHLVRREETRPTTLGSCSEIGLDDTTGWSMLESAINAFHALLQGCLTTGNALAVQLLAQQMPCDENALAGVGVVEMVFGRFAAHQSRYIREMALTHTAALLAIPLASLDGLDALCMQQLAGHVCCGLVRGLHDAFPQVRLAASKLTAQLMTVISQRELMEQMESYLQHDTSVVTVPERWVLMDAPEHLDDLLLAPSLAASSSSSSMRSTLVSALVAYWRYLFPRLSLNRFYPADSIQTLSRQLYATLLTPQGVLGDIYQRYVLHTVEDALACYVVSSRQGNHSIVEAACCALADLPVRMITCSTAPPHPVLLPYLPLICEALYLAVVDERWPVADMAVQASAQLLHRLPCAGQVHLFHPSDVHATYGDRFLSAYLTCLQHHVLTVRQHACMALLLQLTIDSRVLGMLDDFLTSSLLAALADDTKSKSFLPPAMLAPYADPPAATGPLPMPGQAQKLPARSKGWDCCIDCVDSNRSIFGHELTASALHVLRALCLMPEPHNEQLTALLHGSKAMQTSSAAVYLKLTSQQNIAEQKLPGGRYSLQMHLADVLITLLREEDYPEHGKVADALYRMVSYPFVLPVRLLC